MDDGRCPDIEHHYRHREGYAMALALHDALGWPITALVVDVPMGMDREISHVMHAWVTSPDGRGFDVCGYFDEDYLADTMAFTTGRLVPRTETFASAGDFMDSLRDSSASERTWRIVEANLMSGREQASRVVEEYVLRVHHVEERAYALN